MADDRVPCDEVFLRGSCPACGDAGWGGAIFFFMLVEHRDRHQCTIRVALAFIFFFGISYGFNRQYPVDY